MTNATRQDEKRSKKLKQAKGRKAETVKELELMFTIGGLYIIKYYNQHPFRKFMSKIGFKSVKAHDECMMRARRELDNVNYDFGLWKANYGHHVGL